MVLYLLSIVLPVHFHVGGVYMSGTRTVLLVVTIPIAIRLLGGKLGRVLLTDVLLLAHVMWNILALFMNSPSQAISFGGSVMLEMYGSYLLARNYIRTPEQFYLVCRGLMLALMFTIPFAIYETQTGQALIPTMIGKLPGIQSWGDYYNFLSGRRLGLERSQVIFSHPIHYGLFCASLFSLILIGLKDLISPFRRYLFALLACVGVVASVSSGAILPVALQIGLIIWAWLFRRVGSRWLILCGFFAVCYVVVDLLSNRSPLTVFLSYATLSGLTAYTRIHIFDWGMYNVWANPLFGIGMNDWVRPAWLTWSVDNFWLLIALRYGIPSFLMLAISYLYLVWKVMRRDFGDYGVVWQFRRAWVFTQVSLILVLCTVDVWSTALSYLFFLFGAGAWMATIQLDAVSQAQVSDQIDGIFGRAGMRYTRFGNVRVRRGIEAAGLQGTGPSHRPM